MFKKLLALLLVLAMAFAVVACDTKKKRNIDDDDDDDDKDKTEETSTVGDDDDESDKTDDDEDKDNDKGNDKDEDAKPEGVEGKWIGEMDLTDFINQEMSVPEGVVIDCEFVVYLVMELDNGNYTISQDSNRLAEKAKEYVEATLEAAYDHYLETEAEGEESLMSKEEFYGMFSEEDMDELAEEVKSEASLETETGTYTFEDGILSFDGGKLEGEVKNGTVIISEDGISITFKRD